jgi:hypothetical protein
MSAARSNSTPAPRRASICAAPDSCGIGGVVASAMIGTRAANASKVVRPPSFEIITLAACINCST